MKPIFCGNLEFDARPSDLERLFRRYGKVERVDVKSGFAFVYMDDERDAEDAIRRLDRTEFGRKRRQLRVEWTKQDRGIRRSGDSKRPAKKPSKTLFVINFDPNDTRTRDLEKHFEPYGRILNIRIRRNFAFVQFELQEDATKALDATHLSNFMDSVISVEYASRDDDDIRNGQNSDARGRDRSPVRRNYDQGRSPSPYLRARGSPDYGRGSNPNSRTEARRSPDYGRGSNPNSRTEAKRSPDYGRGSNPNSRTESKRSPDYGRGTSPNSRTEAKRSPDNGRAESPVNERYQSRSPPPRERSRSPPPRERSRSPPPPRERSRS